MYLKKIALLSTTLISLNFSNVALAGGYDSTSEKAGDSGGGIGSLISSLTLSASSASNSGSESILSVILAPFFSSSEAFAAVDRRDAKQMNNVRGQLLACELSGSNLTDCAIVKKIAQAAKARKMAVPEQNKNLGTLISLTLRVVSETVIAHPNEPEIFASDEGVTLVAKKVISYYAELLRHDLLVDNTFYDANFYYGFICFLTRSFLQTTISVL